MSDFARDIEPGPVESFWKAGSTSTWPAFIGVLAPAPGEFMTKSGGLPDEPSFPDDFTPRAGKPFLSNTWAGWRRKSLYTREATHRVLLQQLGVGVHALTRTSRVDSDISALAEVGSPVGYSELY